ncbi:centrosomal protein of 126 kDa [Rhynchocyon petersi]
MLTGRPGARSAVADLGAEPRDTRGRAPLSPRDSGGRHRPRAYLDMKIHLEKNLEEERQILLQQQKICRSRARKYFVESNRRKKAFEEKRKEQEEKEHQIREQILQQRKKTFEEVTERFQRAHVPLSQRRRTVFKRIVPPLDEALKQIQGSNIKSELHFLPSHRPTVNWRAIDSVLPSALSKNDHKDQTYLLSKISCDNIMKKNRANMAFNKDAFQLKLEEAQKLLEDQHLSGLQKFCDEVNQITNSETLSSIDSLEAAEHEEIYLTLNKDISTSIPQNSISLKSANLQSANLRCFDKDKLLVSKTQHINNWLINLDNPDTQTATPFSDIPSKPSVLPACETPNNKEQNSPVLNRTLERTTNAANNPVVFVNSPHVFGQNHKNENSSETSTIGTTDSSRTFKLERPFGTESPTFKFSKAWTTADTLTQEVATFVDQEKPSELTLQNAKMSSHASLGAVAMSLVLPPKSQSAGPLPKDSIYIKENDPVQCSDKLDELKDVKDERVQYFKDNKKELPFFSDDLHALCLPHNTDAKDGAQKIAETSSNVIYNYDVIDHHKKMKYSSHDRNDVRLLKSILKKESKYDPRYFKALIMNQDCKFGTQRAAAIRDSIELTKQKGKGADIPKTIKKLRWFDETGIIENNADENHRLRSGTGISQQCSQQFHAQTQSGAASNITSAPACTVNCADREKSKDESASENVPLVRSETDPVPLNCFPVPSGYNFAKQAWLASKKEESKSLAFSCYSKTQKANAQRNGASVIRRARSAKVQSGFRNTNRKGTVFQPHSESKAKTYMQAQDKLIVPHPPPKSAPHIRSGKSRKESQYQSAMPGKSPNITTQNSFNSKDVLPVEYRFTQWTQESSPALSDGCSDLVTVMPSLPSYYTSECQTLAKQSHSNGTQMVAQQDGTLYCTPKRPVNEESHHSVTLKTTGGEESVPLWKRGHNILGPNEKADASTVMRRKHIVENKQRGLSVKKRQKPGNLGQRNSEQVRNFEQNDQISANEPKQITRGASNVAEVSDSTAEFLMAENLVKASVPEDEILNVINSKQLQKSNLALSRTQRSSICALSAEEQKILQSLNHLNKRLLYMQEAICKNPSMKNLLQVIPLLNSQPQATIPPDAGCRLQRKY